MGPVETRGDPWGPVEARGGPRPLENATWQNAPMRCTLPGQVSKLRIFYMTPYRGTILNL